MKDQYSINEILNAVDDLQNLKREKKIEYFTIKKTAIKKNSDVPSSTLKLIEEAEKSIRSKLQSE